MRSLTRVSFGCHAGGRAGHALLRVRGNYEGEGGAGTWVVAAGLQATAVSLSDRFADGEADPRALLATMR